MMLQLPDQQRELNAQKKQLLSMINNELLKIENLKFLFCSQQKYTSTVSQSVKINQQ